MSLASLEREILTEAKKITKRPKLKLKDILEWSTSEVQLMSNLRQEEEGYFLPENGVWVAVLRLGGVK